MKPVLETGHFSLSARVVAERQHFLKPVFQDPVPTGC